MSEARLIHSERFLSLREIYPATPPIAVIAGPCAVESRAQLELVAQALVRAGCLFLRAGAYKPRTSPYAFQGLGAEGLDILAEVGRRYGLVTVTEVLDPRDMTHASARADILQVGSRNMANTALLRELGQVANPVLLKRGFMSTIEEFFLAAEYLAVCGKRNIILCERGIRTAERLTRYTLDLSCVALAKQLTTLPIAVDLSHSLGRKDILHPMAAASLAAGADALMVEVHPAPGEALSDTAQQLSLDEFSDMMAFLAQRITL